MAKQYGRSTEQGYPQCASEQQVSCQTDWEARSAQPKSEPHNSCFCRRRNRSSHWVLLMCWVLYLRIVSLNHLQDHRWYHHPWCTEEKCEVQTWIQIQLCLELESELFFIKLSVPFFSSSLLRGIGGHNVWMCLNVCWHEGAKIPDCGLPGSWCEVDYSITLNFICKMGVYGHMHFTSM